MNVKVPKQPCNPFLLVYSNTKFQIYSLFSMPMAAATVDHHLPLIDLRLLSHSELLSLSLGSSSNAIKYDEDDEDSTPKIDASVFNESAGSRKQTFSRLRLAPRNSSPLPPQIPSPAPVKSLDEENLQIVSLLKSLLNVQSHSSTNAIDDNNDDDGQLIPVPVEFEEFSNANENGIIGLQNIPVELVSCCEMKRKRGRPRKDGRDCGWLIASENDKNKIMVSVVNEKRKRGRPRKNETTVVGSETVTVKRKRGRPRKNESGMKMISSDVTCETRKLVESENNKGKMVKEMVTENRNGVVVDLDLVPLATVEDPLWEELRTERMDKDDQLSLKGFWKL